MNLNNIKVTFTAFGLIIVVVCLSWVGWSLKRTINYNWYYKDSVKETIREQVQPLQDRIEKLEWTVKILADTNYIRFHETNR
jgi:hypothetical protein